MKSPNDRETTIQELKDLVIKFRDERGWKHHHTPKSLAISITLEAAELLEHFQWDDYTKSDKQGLADELADILFNMLNFADVTDIDIATAFLDKFKRVEKKYPTEIFNPGHDDKAAYNQIKQDYRKGKK